MPEVAVQSLPPVKVLATGQPIVASAEKAQISSISVETGKPGTKSHKSTLIKNGIKVALLIEENFSGKIKNQGELNHARSGCAKFTSSQSSSDWPIYCSFC